MAYAITTGMVWTGLIGSGGPAHAQKIDCAVAKVIAGRAYERLSKAIDQGKDQVAMANKLGFWDIEEYSRDCQSVRALANALTSSGLRKDDVIHPPAPLPQPSGGVVSVPGVPTGNQLALNGTVMMIEVMPRAQAGSASAGATGSAGVTGSSSDPDRIFRVTLQLDDGSTRVITQDTPPNFRSGDRVNLSGGVVLH
jgi:hypothetical protein